MMNMYPYQNAFVPQQQGGIVWVQGEAGAKSYIVAPGTSTLLLDSESPTFYIKTTDASGMPQPLRTFDFKERSAAQQPAGDGYVTKEELAERLGELKEELLKAKGEE